MRPLVGVASALLQYALFADHPLLRIYPTLADSALGPGSFAFLLLLINAAASMRNPRAPALAALLVYLAEVALASPTLRAHLPLPQLPEPNPLMGILAVLLVIAASARGLHGLYLALTATPGALAYLVKDVVPHFDPQLSAAFITAGFMLIAVAVVLDVRERRRGR